MPPAYEEHYTVEDYRRWEGDWEISSDTVVRPGLLVTCQPSGERITPPSWWLRWFPPPAQNGTKTSSTNSTPGKGLAGISSSIPSSGSPRSIETAMENSPGWPMPAMSPWRFCWILADYGSFSAVSGVEILHLRSQSSGIR